MYASACLLAGTAKTSFPHGNVDLSHDFVSRIVFTDCTSLAYTFQKSDNSVLSCSELVHYFNYPIFFKKTRAAFLGGVTVTYWKC